ncbi:beta-lactamase family protein [Microbispora sp. NEAU-D428]|uniref:serine hydrolase domain-containing protein n=1 Tax=Microbispora sitophila TaxID=2771537 RepID=UPI0018674214|nr:serine hydrolase domain-containing protein [Microbispora sitophila]MBE3015714.1 beta-lactamase family protein [Microbispora sitophila]
MTAVHGRVHPGFEAVRAAFARGQHDDGGAAQLAVYQDGRLVVDLWAGGDPIGGRTVGGDSLGIVMSVSKGAVATCAHMLSQRGVLDLDAPVTDYWPEFATGGKARIRVSDLLSHRAGLSGFDPFDPEAPTGLEGYLDWAACVAALEAMSPLWEPGTAMMYHALTYGYLVGEVIRRATGRTVGAVLSDLVAGPLGLDLWIGLPESEEHRFVPQFSRQPQPSEEEVLALLTGLGLDPADRLVRATAATFRGVAAAAEGFNRREAHVAEVPAANGIANARSLARMYAATIGEVDGVRLLDGDSAARASAPQTDDLPAPPPFDRLPGPESSRFGLGYELSRPGLPMLGEGSFGHAGAGGRLAYAQPRTGTAVAYVCTDMSWNPAAGPDPRWVPWTRALRDIVSGAS